MILDGSQAWNNYTVISLFLFVELTNIYFPLLRTSSHYLRYIGTFYKEILFSHCIAVPKTKKKMFLVNIDNINTRNQESN